MIALIIFLFFLTTYQIINIFDMKKEDRKKLIIIYSVFLILTILLGLYYNNNKYDTSLASHILKICKIEN